MNRLVSVNRSAVTHDHLPPIRREGPLRILFLSVYALGWRTYAEQLERHTVERTDLDATHVRLVPPLWMRIINRPVPFTNRDHFVHPVDVWRWTLRVWFGDIIRQRRFDVIHCSTLQQARGLVDLKRVGGFRLSVSLDSTEPLYIRELKKLPYPPDRHIVGAERSVLEAADLIVSWSNWAAKSVREDYGVAAERIHVAQPVIGGNEAAMWKRPSRQSGGLLRIVFVGNDFERKGGRMLVRWHQRHWASQAELHICASSASPDRSARNVFWHGRVPHDRLVTEILPRMDLFVLPTQCDWSSFATSEAQAFGIPSVVSRIGGIPDLLVDGETGFLVDPQDEAGFVQRITWLLENESLRQRMGAAALALARDRLSARRLYDSIFDRILALGEHNWMPHPVR